MSLFTRFSFNNLIIIFAFYILSSIKLVFSDAFIGIKKLSLFDSYFVVLETGLYIYNFNNLDCSIILSFNSTVYKNNSNDKIIINGINDEYNSFILCLVNEYFFIFNEKNNKTNSYKMNDIIPQNKKYYDLLPFKLESNNMSLIFVFYNNASKLIFYFYNFSLTDGINEPIEISFDNIKIKNYKISCQIDSYLSMIRCFYHELINDKKYISTATFLIKDRNITLDGISNFKANNSAVIKSIKTAKSNNNNYFICFTEDGHPVCCINNYTTNEINKIGCQFGYAYGQNYRVFYFNETGDFMFTSECDLTTTIFNTLSNKVEKCTKQILTPQYSTYSIIYQNIINNYNYVNYKNFTNFMTCNNISISEEENQPIISSLIMKTTNIFYTTNIPKIDESSNIINYISNNISFSNNITDNIENNVSYYNITDDSSSNALYNINNTTIINQIFTSSYNNLFESYLIKSNSSFKKEVINKTKEEIFNDLDDVLKDKEIGVNYEIKGEDFTMIIKPTNSTPLPNTTHVEFDECEKIIRKKYNISNSSIITFLQIEMENNNQNSLYNQIILFIMIKWRNWIYLYVKRLKLKFIMQ